MNYVATRLEPMPDACEPALAAGPVPAGSLTAVDGDEAQAVWLEAFALLSAMVAPDRAFADIRAAEDIDFIERMVQPEAGAMVLDVPCGGGRHALELSRRGFNVTGVDQARAAIGLARKRAAVERLSARFLKRDMRELHVGEPFDGAVCLGNGIALLDRREAQLFLNLVAANLKPGGWLVLDCYSCAESILPQLPTAEGIAGQRSWRRDAVYDLETGRLVTFAAIEDVEGVRARSYAHRVATVGELLRGMTAAGICPTGTFAGTTGQPFQVGSPRLLVTARKAY